MRRITCLVLALMLALSLAACGSSAASNQGTVQTDAAGGTGVEDGVLSIAMECAYAPFNWTQTTQANGAVPIEDFVPEFHDCLRPRLFLNDDDEIAVIIAVREIDFLRALLRGAHARDDGVHRAGLDGGNE